MRTMKSRAIRDRLARPGSEQLTDGIGGTVTGGPMEPIDLMELLQRACGASRGGAVSGAAQSMNSTSMNSTSMNSTGGRRAGPDHAIALSDGSRISFASVADAGVLRDEDARVFRRESAQVLTEV